MTAHQEVVSCVSYCNAIRSFEVGGKQSLQNVARQYGVLKHSTAADADMSQATMQVA